jgi:hypothetical protein
MSMAKRIPYAVANYEKIVDGDYYFVDKTRFIHELERYEVPVFLRPRRFGKSLWCSILECYYDINRQDRFEDLFGHTDIGQNPTASRNSHLVLRFDFSKISVSEDANSIRQSFDNTCRNAISIFAANYAHIADFQPVTLDTPSASTALESILTIAEAKKTPPVHIIIDEYDNFTNQLLTRHKDHLYRELTTGDSFLRTFYKIIKAGIGDGSVARVFITGVLPVTMDDLTSGFNIGQIITLKPNTLNMMGFTDTEVDTYLKEIFTDHGWQEDLYKKVRDDLRSHYNGYRLLPTAKETLYNSTICNFYLNDLLIDNGCIPRETIDHNLRVDIEWLRRLTGGEPAARELVEQLMFDGTLTVDLDMLSSKFNMNQFFEKRFLPLSPY